MADTENAAANAPAMPTHCKLTQLITDPSDNVRKREDPKKLMELVGSLKRQGQLQAIGVKLATHPTTGDVAYRVIYGFRRAKALEMAGIEDALICFPKEVVNAEERLAAGLTENLQREEMNAYDIATALRAIKKKMEEHEGDAVTHTVLAQSMGLSPSYVTQHLKVFELSNDSQIALRDGEINWSVACTMMRAADPAYEAEVLAKALKGATGAELKAELDAAEAAEVVENAVAEAKNTVAREVLDAKGDEDAEVTPELVAKVSDEAVDKASATTDTGVAVEQVKKKAAKKKAAATDDEPEEAEKTLVELYAEMKPKMISGKALMVKVLEIAGKLERAKSDEMKKEYAYILKGLEYAGGLSDSK